MSKKNRATDRAARAAAALEEQQRQERRRRNTMIGGVVLGLVAIVAVLLVLQSVLSPEVDEEKVPATGSEFGLTIGPDDAPSTVVIYEDFHCVHCADLEERTSGELSELAAEGAVQVEYRPLHFLSDYSGRATNAFKVVLDVAGADAAKEFHDLLFEHYDEAAGSQDGLSDDTLVELAGEAGADEDEVRAGIEDLDQQAWVDDATKAAQEAGVSGTPTILLDGAVFQDGGSTEEIAENLISELE